MEILKWICGRKGKAMIPCTNIKCPHYQRAEKEIGLKNRLELLKNKVLVNITTVKLEKRRNSFEASANVVRIG